MLRERVVAYRDEVRAQFRAAFSQDHPPHLIGASFAVGVFVTTLPTLGVGILVLAAIGYRYAWANHLALFLAVAVLNPLVKTSVHAMSFVVGTTLLGPVPGLVDPEFTVDEGREVLVRLLVGNAVLAVVFALAGYGLAFYCARSVRRYRE